MFVRIQKKRDRHGEMRYYAAVVRGERVKGKVVHTVIANIGLVEKEQIPYLKAAYSKEERPRLVWDDGTEYRPGDPIEI